MFSFRVESLFCCCSVNIPIDINKPIYQVPLLQKEDTEWGLEDGYKYIHLGLIQFGINPLVHPGLKVSFLACVIDSFHNQFSDALIGGFQAPLNNGHA